MPFFPAPAETTDFGSSFTVLVQAKYAGAEGGEYASIMWVVWLHVKHVTASKSRNLHSLPPLGAEEALLFFPDMAWLADVVKEQSCRARQPVTEETASTIQSVYEPSPCSAAERDGASNRIARIAADELKSTALTART